jgi:hypothetical protein
MQPTIHALDRLDHVTACIEAVSDLYNPEPDLHAVNRDKQALLLSFLVAELVAAREQLNQSIRR